MVSSAAGFRGGNISDDNRDFQMEGSSFPLDYGFGPSAGPCYGHSFEEHSRSDREGICHNLCQYRPGYYSGHDYRPYPGEKRGGDKACPDCTEAAWQKVSSTGHNADRVGAVHSCILRQRLCDCQPDPQMDEPSERSVIRNDDNCTGSRSLCCSRVHSAYTGACSRRRTGRPRR